MKEDWEGAAKVENEMVEFKNKNLNTLTNPCDVFLTF